MQSVLAGARSERILVTYRCIVKLAIPAKQSAESNVFWHIMTTLRKLVAKGAYPCMLQDGHMAMVHKLLQRI